MRAASRRLAGQAWPRCCLLAGCRTLPPTAVIGPGADAPWPEQRAALEKLDRYGLNGRVAVAAQGQGFSARLRYQQQPQPLESRARRAVGHRWLARRARRRGHQHRHQSRREARRRSRARRTRAAAGFPIAADELRWWLLGIPAPGEASINQDAGSGEIRDFTQNGWHVSINSRAAGLGFALPQRLTAEREGARLKLLVENWQP